MKVTLTLIASLGLLSGCASKVGFSNSLPQEGPTMLELYDNRIQPTSAIEVGYEPPDIASINNADPSKPLNPGYTRTEQNQSLSPFERLYNPDIHIYVYPHLAGSAGLPIPGYSTMMPLLDKVHYAAPGEQP